MDLDGQSGHEPKLADTQIMTDTQVITDINDNTQIVLEPPKSPNQKLSYCSRRHNQSQLTKMTTIVTVHPSESSVVYQKMEKCSIAVCNDEELVAIVRSFHLKANKFKNKSYRKILFSTGRNHNEPLILTRSCTLKVWAHILLSLTTDMNISFIFK